MAPATEIARRPITIEYVLVLSFSFFESSLLFLLLV